MKTSKYRFMEDYLGCNLVGEMKNSKIIDEINLFSNQFDLLFNLMLETSMFKIYPVGYLIA